MAGTPTSPKLDRRVQRSRTALRDAFHRLILERGYEAIAVADVTELADVGRSTFYQHYAGLDDLLTQSLDRHFTLLAKGSLAEEPDDGMIQVLVHFWENRRVANALFAGSASRVLMPLAAERFETGLSAQWPGRLGEQASRRKLLATQLAAGQLAVLSAWLSGRLSASAPDVGETLRRSCRAAALAVLHPPL